jgi:L-histidine Nalpha-methyltransferase
VSHLPTRESHTPTRESDIPARIAASPPRKEHDMSRLSVPKPVLDVHLTPADAERALRADARAGLTATPKELPPKYFYDARGSELFEEITALPEYYPTRTERALLAESVGAIAAASGADTIVELGSGSSAKTRLLLAAFRPTLRRYVPQDVSEAALRGALDTLGAEYPGLELHGVVGDFTKDLGFLPRGGRRMIAFLGGTIGNLRPAERAAFLAHVRSVLEPGEQLLLGTGLVIDEPTLVAAYADAAGVTAEFNRNVLHVLNRELGADFEPEAFAHVALWDAANAWIEMRLRASRPMRVRVAELELEVEFAAGEELRTEISAKFEPGTVRAMLGEAGFDLVRWWADAERRFALSLATAV